MAGHLPLLEFPATIFMQARTETTLSKGNTKHVLFRTELNYVYVLDRQVLDRGGGP